MTNQNVLIVFVKNPIAGKVKTRLATSIGKEDALKVYQYLQRYTRQVVGECNADIFVYYSDHIEMDDLWNGFPKDIQRGQGLGDRMKDAIKSKMEKGYKNVCLIGSDCRELTSDDLKEAFEMLIENEVVFGPAKDGGYYLIGMHELQDELFDNIPWSTKEVLSLSLNKCKSLDLEVSLMATHSDVDYLEDFPDYKKFIN